MDRYLLNMDDAPLGFSDAAIVSGALIVVGACLWPWFPVVSVVLGLGGGAALAAVAQRSGVARPLRRVGVAGAVLVVAVLAVAVGVGVWAGRAKDGLSAPSQSYDAVAAVVRSDPEPSIGGDRVDVSLAGHRWMMTVPYAQRGSTLRVGDHLVVAGSTVAFPVRRSFQDARHLAGRFRLRRIVSREPGGFPYAEANVVRSVLLRSSAGFSDTQRTLFAGFVLGDVSSARPEITDDFRASGLSHLVVVSGQNLAFLLAGVGPLTAVFGRRTLWMPAVLRLTVVIAFVFVARFEPSVLRAAVMASVMIVTRSIGRPQPLLRILMMSVVCLLLVDPLLVRSVGFGLSVGAVAGIAVLSPLIADRLVALGWIAGPLAMTIAAQIGTAPIALLLFDGVPVVSVLANVLAMPLAAPIMSWGVLAGLPAGLIGPRVGEFVHVPTRALLTLIGGVARIAASLPFGSLRLVDCAVLVVVGGLLAVVVIRARVVRSLGVAVLLLIALVLPTGRAMIGRSSEVSATSPRTLARGVVIFGAATNAVWRHVDVLVLSHGVSASSMLEALRKQRIGSVGLVVVVSGGKPQVAVVRAVLHRARVGMVLSAAGVGAPPGGRWKQARAGLVLRSGSVSVEVVGMRDRRLDLAIS